MTKRSQQALRSSLNALRDEYDALKPAECEKHAAAAEKLKALFSLLDAGGGKQLQVVTHDHIRSASRFLIELLPEENLYFRVAQVRKALSELSSSPTISAEFQKKLDEFELLSPEAKRAAASELQRVRAAVSIDTMNAEVFKATVVNTSLIAALMLMAMCAGLVFLLAQACQLQLALFPFAAFFGAFGAWISTASRIKDTNPLALARHAEFNTAHTSSIWISPLFGAIGAVLAFGALKTGIVGSSLVLAVDAVEAAGCKPWIWDSGLIVFQKLTSDKHIGATFILALVALAAGWSERLVPDMLEWVGNKVRPDTNT